MNNQKRIKVRLEVEEENKKKERLMLYTIALWYARMEYWLRYTMKTNVPYTRESAVRFLDSHLTEQDKFETKRILGDVLPAVGAITVAEAWESIVIASVENINKSIQENLREMSYTSADRFINDWADKYSMKKTPMIPANEIIDTPWSGKSGSQRAVTNVLKMRVALSNLLSAGKMNGKTPDDILREVLKQGRYTRYEAVRLTRTEVAAIDSLITKEMALRTGATRYRLDATLDKRTSKICRGMDQTVHRWEDAKIGVNLPPLHPNCRTVAVIIPWSYSII